MIDVDALHRVFERGGPDIPGPFRSGRSTAMLVAVIQQADFTSGDVVVVGGNFYHARSLFKAALRVAADLGFGDEMTFSWTMGFPPGRLQLTVRELRIHFAAIDALDTFLVGRDCEVVYDHFVSIGC